MKGSIVIFRSKKEVHEQKISGNTAINESLYRHVQGIEMQPSLEFRNKFLAIYCGKAYNINVDRYNNDMAQRLRWFGHVHKMANGRMDTKLYQWKPISSRLAGRPKIRWKTI
jgi:hypothetical protein